MKRSLLFIGGVHLKGGVELSVISGKSWLRNLKITFFTTKRSLILQGWYFRSGAYFDPLFKLFRPKKGVRYTQCLRQVKPCE
jgi:hypothetical protein